MTSEFVYDVPQCPKDNSGPFKDTSITIIMALVAFESLIFAFLVACKFNSVIMPQLYNKIRKIHSDAINNSRWILWFFLVAVRSIVESVLFGVKDLNESLQDIMTIVSVVLHALGAFVLGIALNEQRIHKNMENPGETIAFVPQKHRILSSMWSHLCSIPSCLAFLLILVFIAIIVRAMVPGDTAMYVYWACLAVQKMPVFFLGMHVALVHKSLEVGPSTWTKVILTFAMVFYLPSDMPIEFWGKVLPHTCFLVEASLFDIVLFLFLLCVLLLFIYVRGEYSRNLEIAIWDMVSQIQDTFDFRHF
eukprot:TRINITY_DN1737_c0_g1_i2.p1 TRINITY_DN1737_c0_g1~~TRINITY_DN1737_c0_g1_i2.p1  ORF type:complete len:305 (+),score=39.23 TRINITY_DN1737_c0_g1_i2:195-1109(+)